MNNKIALSSLAMDLKRVAVGYHKGSLEMSKRFYEEAFKQIDEMQLASLEPYIKNIIKKVSLLETVPSERVAEDALMYSTLLQNYVVKYLEKIG